LNVRRSAEEESRAWSNIKVVRQLKPGAKNVSVLNGIGDEAWFDGHVEKGKLGTGGVLAHKGRSDFMLESAVLAYRASPEIIEEHSEEDCRSVAVRTRLCSAIYAQFFALTSERSFLCGPAIRASTRCPMQPNKNARAKIALACC